MRKHLAGAAVFPFILFGWMIYRAAFPRARHPSDESLMANFQAHRTDFEKLIKMTSEVLRLIQSFLVRMSLINVR